MGSLKRISGRKPPPDYLSRAIQQRLLMLVGMLLLVLMLMQYAARPRTWQWLWQEGSAENPAVVSGESGFQPALDPQQAQRWYPPLKRSLLATIQDDTFFRHDEQAVWFHMLELLENSDQEELHDHSLGPVSYLQLYRQTPSYRGRLVSLRGTLRRAQRVTAADNALGIQSYWQCWLFPQNSRNPLVIYALEVGDDSFSGGSDLAIPAESVGFVFKRWSYEAVEGLSVAPVLLAKQLNLPTSSAIASTPGSDRLPRRDWPMLFLIAGAGALLVTLAIYRYTAAFGQARIRNAAPLPIELPGGIELPEEIEAPGEDPS